MIQPIVTPNIDFVGLLHNVKIVLERNLNSVVDINKNISTKSNLAYLCELLELSERNVPINMIGELNIIKALSYGFLTGLEDEDIVLLNCYTALSIVCSREEIQKKHLVIITGNLMQWKNAIVYFSTQSNSYILKILSSHLYHYFDKIGLARTLWAKYNPVFKSTGELLLELK